jgi:hypothetical protein
MKMYDYECEDGHKIKDEMFLDTEVPPEEMSCLVMTCKKPAKRVAMYANPGVRLPMSPATFSRGH